MTDQSHREWQRETVLRKIGQLRDEYAIQGRPCTDRRLAETAAPYVGAETEQVLRWMRGER